MTADFPPVFLRAARLGLTLAWLISSAAWSVAADAEIGAGLNEQFLETHCLECHQGSEAEGKLDLQGLSRDITGRAIEERWVRIYDRIKEGEMPPKGAPHPAAEEKAAFLKLLQARLLSFREIDDRTNGRVRGRRLTRREMGTTL